MALKFSSNNNNNNNFLQENAALLFDLEKETESDCAKYGVVKKVTVYDVMKHFLKKKLYVK